ncbi:formate-dependent uric acid utilization protein AegA [Enterobacter cloacae]|uniref:formate-dependent uric acid utilization protein AegA n=1 Tax=Enterobacter TaxID=547 RepID=UPI000D1D4BA0|nr:MULTISPECIES: formate-dependent uric acid utilization protein AegA [Enterobacter]MBJ6384499.1 formate-dependent uric acid utilization protein AegA [Enterobacter cloacae]MBJ6402236.1 formate-dependent uric acid utilization protein AegA [Enterobacter cloacae]MBJ6433640.1 formate-dependent uric acid utilization protein AegA [Enterobacter cloacae]MBJ6458220.1 formate-dependent uric acid utilization protein AegA [Enterobacter cloacae]MBJ6484491.1 formate-dependent uric acid utilization protein A
MNRFIMVNGQECIGCRACEVACVMAHNGEQHVLSERHFHPRITVLTSATRTSPVTCHHCENAPCAQSCPNGAITQHSDSVQVNQQKCIGCKACVVACPFGTMDMLVTPLENDRVKASAHKCDLCLERPQGPACVENCPANVLTLATPAVLDNLAKSRRERSARLDAQPWHSEAVQAECPQTKRQQRQNTPARGEPDKLSPDARARHFNEISLPFRPEQAHREASRCLKCGEHSICEWTCPLHNHIPQWIERVRAGDIVGAAELSHQTNCLPEITGRVCPQDRLCEGACTLRDASGAVTIGNIERYISDRALATGWMPDVSHVMPVGQRVAIVGAGPAGLACADVLVRCGVEVTVYDRHPEIGGLLTFGIPAFKLDKSLLARRREIFSAMGIRFELNCELGKDVSMAQLQNDYDAIFLGVGTYRSMKAGIPHEDAPGVYDALPFLVANTRNVMGLEPVADAPFIDTQGLNVVVLGGGDTAMDCVRTALRHGAAKVTCAYRRDEANMPGSKKEVKNAKEEGAAFEFNVQPVELTLDVDGKVNGVRMLRTALGEPDAQGRRRPVPVAGSEFVMPADAVIMAFGFTPHAMPWLQAQGVDTDDRGRIRASVESRYRYQTSNPQIFAGGDAVRGADLVVTAMAEGRHAAQGIMDWLGVPPRSMH